jgi:hypothetical protein
VKEAAWYVLGFATAIAAVALGLLLAPDAADAHEAAGGLLSHLTRREWADLAVAVVAGIAAFAAGSYLSARAAAEPAVGERAPGAEPGLAGELAASVAR